MRTLDDEAGDLRKVKEHIEAAVKAVPGVTAPLAPGSVYFWNSIDGALSRALDRVNAALKEIGA
jgi:hypothetical protein